MQYLGGKARIAKRIVEYLERVRKPNQTYLEPFVGAANVICRMSGPRIGSDHHEDLILLLEAVRDKTIELPERITEEEYYRIKGLPACALRGFVGFGCSFSGRWFMGMARCGSRNYCLNAKNSLLKKQPGLQGIQLACRDYRTYDPVDYLIYNDPPYADVTRYTGSRGSMRSFNHEEFWEVMRKWSKHNTVLVSEYKAPADFECVLEITTKTDLRTKANIKEPRIERLFSYIQ